MALPFEVVPPLVTRVPILISMPHSGTAFPEELRPLYKPHLIDAPEDTDWFLDRIYDFAPQLGITVIKARLSRWVIDLNRDPEHKPLYDDGRIITELCPTKTFLGEPIYENGVPDDPEISKRLTEYYWPYYEKIQEQLDQFKTKFGKALLWDAHSIKQLVPTIREDPFPDLVLGDNDGTSAHEEISKQAFQWLNGATFKVKHNDPFKGGHITRYFGKPEENQHVLQLEMTKINYMDDSETKFEHNRAKKIKTILRETLVALIKKLEEI